MQHAIGIECAPVEALHQTGCVNRNDVQDNSNGRQPEVQCDPRRARDWRLKQPWRKPVDHSKDHESNPAQCAGMHVRNGPVGVVTQRIHTLNAEERTLERAHAIERDGEYKEFQHWISSDLAPRTTQCQESVDHSAP